MLTKLSDVRSQENADSRRIRVKTQALLWSIWTLYVIGFAIVHWQFDLAAGRPAPVVGLIIHTLLAGLIGLIVMTLVEMRIDPERFIDTQTPPKR